MSAEIIKLLEEQKERVPVEAYRKGLEYAIQAIKQANQPKECDCNGEGITHPMFKVKVDCPNCGTKKPEQKQALIEMMKGDEELGVYENELREGKITIHIEPTKTGYSAHYELGDAVIATTGVDIPEIFGNLKEATELAQE